MTVDLFIPCFIDQLYPETGFNTIKILEKLDIEVQYNPEQTCCGQPTFNSGYWNESRELAYKFCNDFPNDRPVISPSASCIAFVKNYYPELLKDTIFLTDLKRLQQNMFELSDFLVNNIKVTDLGSKFEGTITFHDSCSALREYGIKNEPRKLLEKVKGLKIIEMNESDTCCGFGGTFSVKNEAISTAMAQQKVENAIESGAEYIVSTEASCILHMEAYIKKHKSPIKIKHLADILASGL
ncbi:(Fe-S)-binding protein [Bacteroidota bacterium]